MRWSIKIARIAGIDVRIHITFLLFLTWIGFTYYQVGGSAAAIDGVLFILALFGCVLLHEFGHALAARGFGIRTPDAARAIAENANGAVVGTALVDALRASLDAEGRATPRTVGAVADLVSALAQGVRGARQAAE